MLGGGRGKWFCLELCLALVRRSPTPLVLFPHPLDVWVRCYLKCESVVIFLAGTNLVTSPGTFRLGSGYLRANR